MGPTPRLLAEAGGTSRRALRRLPREGDDVTGGFFSEGAEAMRTASAARRRAAWIL